MKAFRAASTPPTRRAMFIIAIVIVVADQMTKAWARNHLKYHADFIGRSRIGFELTSNSGSAFSLFRSSTLFLTLIAIVIGTIVVIAAVRTKYKYLSLAYTLIAAGAIGNIIDRFTQAPHGGHGHVTDFIRIESWPTFNIADSCITLGAILLIVVTLFGAHDD